MGDKETTPPVAAASPASASTAPQPKRMRTTSPPTTAVAEAEWTAPEVTTEPLPDGDEEVEADDDVGSESGYGTDNSDQTSITSSIYQGYLEHGRRYQTKREGEYWGPSDEKQFEHMSTIHVMFQVLEAQQPNRLFRSPISENAQNILDLGTGNGAWARDVADQFPNIVVRGIDLFPPPDTWVPPNCVFEVDDVLKPWLYAEKFDLIHLRGMVGAFEKGQWRGLYKQAYEKIAPGGWIEQVDLDTGSYSDDGTLPLDSALANWGRIFDDACAQAGKATDMIYTMRGGIEAAGFINAQEKTYKVPCGDWAKHPILKEAGRLNKAQFKEGMEGFAMFILTHFGTPQPWSAEEVQVYLAKVRRDLESGYHSYWIFKRVFAQKPFDVEPAKEAAGVEVVDVVNAVA